MCDINWNLLLEYLKVILGWPPVGLVIAMLIIFRFKSAIDDFLKGILELTLFGQTIKREPAGYQQKEPSRPEEDRLTKAAEEQQAAPAGEEAQPAAPIPAELANDPHAPAAIAYVRANPEQTVIEYKRLFFNFNAERLFNLIYGSQISLLVYLQEHQGERITLPQLVQFHDAHQAQTKQTNYQLRDYVNFLVTYKAITVGGTPGEETYSISTYGVEFLSYIKANFPTAWDKRFY